MKSSNAARRASVACATLLLAQAASHAEVLLVPEQYATITAACQSAWAGDTVSIAPDDYRNEHPIIHAGVTIRGRGATPLGTCLYDGILRLLAGVDTTRIENVGVVHYELLSTVCVYNYNAGAVFHEVLLYGGNEMCLIRSDADVRLLQCWLYPGPGHMEPFTPVYLEQQGRVLIKDCVFYYTEAVDFRAAPSGSRVELFNNTFRGGEVCISVYTMTEFYMCIVNCIMRGARCHGSGPDTLEWRYNDFTDGLEAWPECGTLIGNFSADPMFCLEWGGDYRIDWESPCHAGGEGGEDVGARLGYCNEPSLSVRPYPDHGGTIWLSAPWPNPTSTWTSMVFEAPPDVSVELRVLDVSGREVRVLRDNRPHGRGMWRWDCRDAADRPVHAGMYYLHLRAGDEVQRRRLTVIR